MLIQSGFSPSAHALQGREALKLALWQFSPPIPFSSLGSPVSRLYSRYSPRAAGPGGSDNFTPGALNYSSPANRLARLLFFFFFPGSCSSLARTALSHRRAFRHWGYCGVIEDTKAGWGTPRRAAGAARGSAAGACDLLRGADTVQGPARTLVLLYCCQG